MHTGWTMAVAAAIVLGVLASVNPVNGQQNAADCAEGCVCQFEVVVTEYGKGQGMQANCSGAKLRYLPAPLPAGTTTLFLTENKFSRLWAISFRDLTFLRNLYLDHNRMKKIRRNYFGRMPGLYAMYLQNNLIDQIAYGAFMNTSNLRFLNLGNNKLALISHAQFEGLPRLKNLDLSSNLIETLQDGAFLGLWQLEKLDLSGNRLTVIKPHTFADVYSLKELYLDRNKISTVSGVSFATLNDLHILSLSSNLISYIPQRFMDDLENLEELFLHRNRITKIDPWTFSTSQILRKMFLYSNLLTSIPKYMFSGLVRLEVLQLAFNAIEYVADDAFRDLHSLRRMYLDANKLRVITPKTFTGLGNVRDMNLYFNTISYVARGTFDPLKKLSRLTFDTPHVFQQLGQDSSTSMGNRLLCDCNVRWLKEWLLETNVSTVTCYAPPRLNGKFVTQLEESDLKCDPLQVQAERRTILTASGEDVSMRCITNVGATVSWAKNGTEVVEDEYHVSTPLGTLNIAAAADGDTGDYTCIAQNEAHLVAAAVTLTIGERPTFVLYPEDVDVTEPLKTAIFTCKAEGKPKPRITWYKEDHLIQGPASDKQSQFHITTNGALVYTGKRYHVTNEGSLIIVDPVSEDEGSLKCVAENSLGRVSHKVTLYLDMSSKCRQGCRKGGTCLPVNYDCVCSRGYYKVDNQCKKDTTGDNSSGSGGSGGSGVSGSASGDDEDDSGYSGDEITGETDDGQFTTLDPGTLSSEPPTAS